MKVLTDAFLGITNGARSHWQNGASEGRLTAIESKSNVYAISYNKMKQKLNYDRPEKISVIHVAVDQKTVV